MADDAERVIVSLSLSDEPPTADEVARWRARENGFRARTGQPPLPEDSPMINPYVQPGYKRVRYPGVTRD